MVIAVICLSIITVFLCICMSLGYAWSNKRHPRNKTKNGDANFVDLHLAKKKSKSTVQNVDNNDKIESGQYKINRIGSLTPTSQSTPGGVKDVDIITNDDSDGSVLEKNINYNTDEFESNHGEAEECSDSIELVGDTSNGDMYAIADETEVVTKGAPQEVENINENVLELQVSEPPQIEGDKRQTGDDA